MSVKYIELRARSAFSFLEGSALPEDLVERAAELGYPALAMGDRDGLYGAPRFYHGAERAGLRAIVGAELTLDLSSAGAPSNRHPDDRRLYVLVPDRERYRNLCRMITASKMRPLNPVEIEHGRAPEYPAKGESRITLEDLERYGAGLICLAGGARSPLALALTRGDDPRALCDRLGAIFGRGNFHIDLGRHLDPAEERLNRRLAALAAACGVPLVATNDVCHTGADRALLDALTCIRLGLTLEEAGRSLWANAERRLKSPSEMAALFRDLPGAVAATGAIAERCGFKLRDLGYRFPSYPLPPGETPDSYLRLLVEAGARERWGAAPGARVLGQLAHELEVIARLGLAGYFLIVWDIVQFCRESAIMAQGRGSAANSAVCYALGITAVDAVKMELLFERFLSEERGEWPDIDIDLPSGDQREKVIQYVYRRYGERGAAMTANVITYRTRSAVREVGKVLGFTSEHIDRLARLNYVYEFRDSNDELAALLKRGGVDVEAPRLGRLVDLVRQIQDLPRHLGQHSGGMVIGAGPLDDVVPLEPASMPGRVVIQWDKEDCADLGIIKIDLLGLGMMAVLEEAIPLVRESEGVEVDLAHLPAGDPAVYAMLSRADTIGVFQVESRAQMATLPRMQPRTFYDLVVEVAIIRPGPIVGKMVHPYLDRRAGRAPVVYDHPALEPILRRTLGVPLFQEQLLRMAMAVAGFSGGEAEELRRAMGFKRSAARMEKIERRMREGMARNGIDGATADRIVQSITSFALYGFPESHAASFALIAYASAWLKCHHPAAFFAAMLNCYPLGFYHPSTLVKDAERHGVTMAPIDVARSDWRCTLERGDFSPTLPLDQRALDNSRSGVFHLSLSKGALRNSARDAFPNLSLTKERSPRASRAAREVSLSSAGPQRLHTDLERGAEPLPNPLLGQGEGIGRGEGMFALRLGLRYVAGLRAETGARIERERAVRPFASIADFTARAAPNRRELDALAYAGAFAAFGMGRRAALWQAAAVERDPRGIFAGVEPAAGAVPLAGMDAMAETRADYAATGLTVGPHLMAHMREKLHARGVRAAAELAKSAHGAWVKTAGVVIVRQRPGTAKGFFFLTLEDETGISNAIVVPDLFQANRALLHNAAILMVEGVLQKQDGVIAIRAQRFKELRLAAALPPSHDFR
ncbi:MAG TPA: error-prone DNA polymerase [Candidatus Binataceae bacterium]|nr:error-prone DNA polymerase [Candidatus Binataceae bacterium]